MKARAIVVMVLAVLVGFPRIVAQTEATTSKSKAKSAVKSGKNAKPDPLAGLDDFDVVKFYGGMSKTSWSLAIEHRHADYPAKTAKELAADVEVDDFYGDRDELQPYKSAMAVIATRLGFLGDSLTYFLYGGKHTRVPFTVARYKDQKCFVAFIATDTIYNTLRLSSAKQRASKLATTHGLPALRDLAKSLRDADVTALAVFITYGTKDFLDKGALATKPEVLALVASKEDVLAFADGELTDSELVARAATLVSEREATFDFTKVNLNLE